MKILYICTHNRCRSILSEAITNHKAQGKIVALSGGSQPVEQIHPLTLRYLAERGISTDGLQSQSWDEFAQHEPEVVVTVCDSAKQDCPVWFGQSIQLHWGLADPSRLEGTESQVRAAFFETMDIIEKRVDQLLSIETQQLSKLELRDRLEAI